MYQMLSLLPCPEPGCDAPAEVIDRTTVGSTGGGIEHVRIQCLRRHVFFMPTPPGYPLLTAAGNGYRMDTSFG
jgi:hypothetical protein